MKKHISITLVILLVLLGVLQPTVFAEEHQTYSELVTDSVVISETSGPEFERAEKSSGMRMSALAAPSGETKLVFDINQKKLQFKVENGFDLDKYLYDDSSPIKFTIDLLDFKPDSSTQYRVTLRVYDVDQDGTSYYLPEVDKVYCNGTYLGKLTGANDQWSTVSLNIPEGVLKAGKNNFEVYIDEYSQGWAVEVDWAAIEVPFNIGHIESIVTGDEKIKKGTTDEIIGDTIFKTGFDANGDFITSITNDPIADKIKGSWFFNIGSRSFKYEYKLDCWPAGIKSQIEPVVEYKWDILDTDISSGNYKKVSGKKWSGSFDVTIPDKVGTYKLRVSLKIYYDNVLLREVTRVHRLYVLLDSPAKVDKIFSNSSESGTLTIEVPKTAWLDLSTQWASGKDNANDILSSINEKEHTNPLGWKYGYYFLYDKLDYGKDDAITLLENGSGKMADCYVFRDAWRILAGSLGIETKVSNYQPQISFMTSTVKALDNNNFANASKKENPSVHDRWNFISHALGKYGNTYYDPTFGLSYKDPEYNVYAKHVGYDRNGDRVYQEMETGKLFIVEEENLSFEEMVNKGCWDHYLYTGSSGKAAKNMLFAMPQSIGLNNVGARYTGNYIEELIDEDNNGLYDYLKIDVEFEAEKDGMYSLDSCLCSFDESIIAMGVLSTENNFTIPRKIVNLKKGNQKLSIYFNGKYINEFGADGPYTVKVNLKDMDNGESCSAEIVTNSYKAKDFQSNLLVIEGIADKGVDINGDSMYDTLDFDLSLNVLGAGEFTISGMLFSEDGTYLGSAETVRKLNPGKQTLSLKFVGQALRYSQIDGPYILYIDYDDGKNYGSVEYTSKAYSHEDFQVSDVVFTGKNSDEAKDTNQNSLFDELNISAEVAALVPGEYKIQGILQDRKGNFIQAANTTVAIGEEPVEVQLSFSGIYINKSAVDGPYEVILAICDEEGNDLTGIKYQTNNYKYTDFESPKATFSKTFTDRGIDSNGDSLYDILSVAVGINVAKAGNYSLEGTLSDKNGNFITAIKTDAYLSKGSQTINLNFNGGDIYNNAVDGPYILSSLELVDSSDGESVESLLDAYYTNEYLYTQFQSLKILIVGEPVETAVDTDGNGLYDALKISMDVYIPKYGYYNYNARIMDKNGKEIVWSSGSGSFNAGVRQFTLTFDGRYIYGNGEDGPYEVKDLTIYSGSEVFSLFDFYTTQAYSWKDFEPISVVYGTASTGYMPIENANIFISGVNSDVTNSEGKYRLKVINGGSYNIRIDAPSIYEPWEIWVNGEKYADGTSAYITVPKSGEIEVNFISKADLPPILEPIGNKTVNSNETLEIKLSALEPNGQTVTYSVYNEPKGASFDPVSGIFKWTPLNSDVGVHKDIKFTVSDGLLEDSETIDIKVVFKNRPPIIKPIGNLTVNENELLTVSFAVYDPDGDDIFCTVFNAPEGSLFDSLTNTFTWIPDYSQAGVYDNIRFEVSDGGLSAFEIIQITVNNVNRPPVLNPIGNITAEKGEVVKINLSATDPDGDALTFKVYNAPEGAEIDPIANVFTWMPDYSIGGVYSGIRFVVSDGELSDEEEITITIPAPTPTSTSTPKPTPTTTKDRKSSGSKSESSATPAPTATPTQTPTPTVTPTVTEEAEPTIPAVNILKHKAYLSGYPDGYFKPENNITRAEAAAIFANILKSQDRGTAQNISSFSDVSENHWAYDAINYVATKGIFKGYPDGTFKPDQTITRAEFSVAVFRLLGLELQTDAVSSFSDIKDHWAKEYINQLYRLGYIKGYSDGTFKPDSFIKRSECVALTNRALGRGPLSVKEQIFIDVPPTHWAYEEIAEGAMDHNSIIAEDGKEKPVNN